MKLKKKLIAASIRKDAQLHGRYMDGKGHYCVVGGLLKHAGYPMRQLTKVNTRGVSHLPPDAKELLAEHYGLSIRLLSDLQFTNDSFLKEIEERRAALLAKLKLL